MICGAEHPFDTPDRLLVLNEQGQVTGDIVILTLIRVGTEQTLAMVVCPRGCVGPHQLHAAFALL